jgi:hypothetical protein
MIVKGLPELAVFAEPNLWLEHEPFPVESAPGGKDVALPRLWSWNGLAQN